MLVGKGRGSPLQCTLLEENSPGLVGLYAGEVGEYAGEVGEYAGEVGEYAAQHETHEQGLIRSQNSHKLHQADLQKMWGFGEGAYQDW